VPDLHNNCQKQTQILNCNAKQWGPSFVPCIKVLVIITICLFHQQLCYFKTEGHENAVWGRDLLMWGASVCRNPLGSPVNLQTTIKVGRHVCTVRPLCKVCVSSVTVTLSRNVIFWWMYIRVFYYQICDVSVCKASSCSHTAQCTSTPVSTHQTQHLLTECDSSICTAWLVACYYCSYMEQTHVELMIRHKYQPTFQKSEDKKLTGEWRTFASGPILHLT